jgi:hypothetical protein
MIGSRVMSMSLPVERSITVSAPYFTASRSLPTSLSMEEETAELPMFALILDGGDLADAHGLELAGEVVGVGGDDESVALYLGSD